MKNRDVLLLVSVVIYGLILEVSVSAQCRHFKLFSISGQVSSPADVENALNMCRDKFGRLDVAVSCAGIGIAVKTYNPKKKLAHSFDDFMKVQTVGYTILLFWSSYGILWSF